MTLPRKRSNAQPTELQVNDDAALIVAENTIAATAGGTSLVVALGAASAVSVAIATPTAVVSPTVDCFMRQTDANNATADGTDQFLFGGVAYRVTLTPGKKLAFRTTGAVGNVYITPGA